MKKPTVLLELDILTAARELIADKKHWLQGDAYRRLPNGTVRRCASQAWQDAAGRLTGRYVLPGRLTEASKLLFGKSSVIGVNDDLGWEQVMETYDYAIKQAEVDVEARAVQLAKRRMRYNEQRRAARAAAKEASI